MKFSPRNKSRAQIIADAREKLARLRPLPGEKRGKKPVPSRKKEFARKADEIRKMRRVPAGEHEADKVIIAFYNSLNPKPTKVNDLIAALRESKKVGFVVSTTRVPVLIDAGKIPAIRGYSRKKKGGLVQMGGKQNLVDPKNPLHIIWRKFGNDGLREEYWAEQQKDAPDPSRMNAIRDTLRHFNPKKPPEWVGEMLGRRR